MKSVYSLAFSPLTLKSSSETFSWMCEWLSVRLTSSMPIPFDLSTLIISIWLYAIAQSRAVWPWKFCSLIEHSGKLIKIKVMAGSFEIAARCKAEFPNWRIILKLKLTLSLELTKFVKLSFYFKLPIVALTPSPELALRTSFVYRRILLSFSGDMSRSIVASWGARRFLIYLTSKKFFCKTPQRKKLRRSYRLKVRLGIESYISKTNLLNLWKLKNRHEVSLVWGILYQILQLKLLSLAWMIQRSVLVCAFVRNYLRPSQFKLIFFIFIYLL